MKKIFLVLSCISCSAIVLAQKDPELRKRLNSFVQATQAMDFNKILDYTYPKLFTIVPRDQMLDALEKSLHNEQINIRFDSVKIDSLYPVFSMEGASYAKISSTMKMIMKLNFPANEPDSGKTASNNQLAGAMQGQFGAGNVIIDNGNIIIRVSTPMVAIKDQYAKEWSFSNLKDNDPINDKLFSKEVLNKFASYK
jgi:hypothetical protein